MMQVLNYKLYFRHNLIEDTHSSFLITPYTNEQLSLNVSSKKMNKKINVVYIKEVVQLFPIII